MKEKLLTAVCKGQPCEHGEGYCILKEIILHDTKYSERMLAQMDCVNRFKFDESKKTGRDIGWRSAWELWVECGHAKVFNDLFQENCIPKDLYTQIINNTNPKD